jgi:hypothetical protein
MGVTDGGRVGGGGGDGGGGEWVGRSRGRSAAGARGAGKAIIASHEAAVTATRSARCQRRAQVQLDPGVRDAVQTHGEGGESCGARRAKH